MSRTLSPINSISGLLSNDDDVTGNFADIDKPAAGDWTLKVNLAKSDDCPVSALIEVYQDRSPIAGELLLASTTVSPTTTPTDYELPVTPAQLATGRCHLSQVKVRVTANTEECTMTECCLGYQIPQTLTVSDGSNTFNVTYQGSGGWGSESIGGLCEIPIDGFDQPRFDVQCREGYDPSERWWALLKDSNALLEEAVALSVQCDPLELTFYFAFWGGGCTVTVTE